MKTVYLKIITQENLELRSASTLANRLSTILAIPNTFIIETYYKFPKSYQLTVNFPLNTADDPVIKSIDLTSRICEPWLVYYQNDKNEIELIFNRLESTKFLHPELSVILWANWNLEAI